MQRVQSGQALTLQTVSGVANSLKAYAGIVLDNGGYQVLQVNTISLGGGGLTTDYSLETVAGPGYVTWANVQLADPPSQSTKRGQIWAALSIAAVGAFNGPILAQGYVWYQGGLELGTMQDPGPDGGSGYRRIVTVKATGAPTVAGTTYALGATNTTRKIYGFSWYYQASATVATRTLQAILTKQFLAAALPGTWATAAAAYAWASQALVLTAGQSGLITASFTRSLVNDDGTISIDSQDSAPTPFPLLVTEDSLAELLFNVPLGEADDRDAIYLLAEDWMVR